MEAGNLRELHCPAALAAALQRVHGTRSSNIHYHPLTHTDTHTHFYWGVGSQDSPLGELLCLDQMYKFNRDGRGETFVKIKKLKIKKKVKL